MDRRTALFTIGSGLLSLPYATRAQKPAKVPRIGFMSGGARPADGIAPAAFRLAMQELGYTADKNVTYLGRWAEANTERLPGLAAELVRLDIDVLVTFGGPAAQAAKSATSTIPIVVVAPGDALGVGLVTSLARPDGNITGITDPATELSAKRLGLLKEAIPNATRVAVIWNADDRAMTLRYSEVERAARVLNIALSSRSPFANLRTSMLRYLR